MDPTLCLEHEIRKAQINRESVVAVFFDIEKVYNMMWGEGLLIRIYRWIKYFFIRKINTSQNREELFKKTILNLLLKIEHLKEA